jgi:glycosyltransferase involved in cell wall biosynthesis
MNSIHFRRWVSQLEDSDHEVFWFDIKDQGYITSLSWVHQVTGWKKGFLKRRGRTFLKKRLPKIYTVLEKKYDYKVENAFAKAIQEIQPDIIHSFALYISCTPILEVMKRYIKVPWLYSSWGSDLYYFQNIPEYLKDIKAVLPRVTHLMTDCLRDEIIARKHGFRGEYCGVFPGGGGFDLNQMKPWILEVKERTTILVKGYQGRSGRAIEVLNALEGMKEYLNAYQIVVFGAAPEVVNFCKNSLLDIEVHRLLKHQEVLKLMGQALIYIGNSNSDGMPNTLLEAICMGALPIQSNPGGATEEMIDDGINGFLIEDPLDVLEMQKTFKKALLNEAVVESAFNKNQEIKHKLSKQIIQEEVCLAYKAIAQ